MIDPSVCLRQVDGIEVNEVSDGYVIYDPVRDRAHYLNHTAVLLLELCTGRVSAGELPGLVQAAYGLPAPPEEEVFGCVGRLIDEGLLR
jgi:hypothetical protein